ncbi:MAG: transcription antitermination factor NusB [Candidatus Eremiobacteraeota bacterium]|nr:transcription antitermination factor NusB [Candidatus Eremiobacteraeota bacterium]
MSARTFGREQALRALFAVEVGHREPDETIAEVLGGTDGALRAFVRDLVLGTVGSANQSDARLAPLLEGWTIERLPTIDRLVLRMAVYEMTRGDVPTPVVINEAVELAKRFSTEDSGRFVNGVLSSVARALSEAKSS